MIGVRFNNGTKKFEAFLGTKVLGEFKTKEEAMECYDNKAKTIFAFPVLNKKEQKSDDTEGKESD